MTRAAIALMAIAPSPALAAGGLDDGFEIWLWLGTCLLLSVPAAGVGYVLGSFFRLPASVLVLAIAAAIPIGWVWTSRGLNTAAELALTGLMVLLVIGPLTYAGWCFGRRDAIRHIDRKNLLSNGN